MQNEPPQSERLVILTVLRLLRILREIIPA